MPATGLEASPHNIQLPANGPRLKLTTDLGSAHQQVRNFFQPVTLVGSSPQAHVRIESDVVCDLHCALINTGQSILLKDLHTPTGLLRNREVIRVDVLKDGDVLRIGPAPLHVAVRVPMGSTSQPRVADASSILMMPQVVRVQGPAAAETLIESSVAVIGSRLGCEVYLNHEEVCPVHALMLAFGSEIALCNLDQESRTQVNQTSLAVGGIELLHSGDLVRVGPFELRILLGGCHEQGDPAEPRTLVKDSEAGPELQGPESTEHDGDERPEPPGPAHHADDVMTNTAQQRIRRLLDSVKTLRDGLK